jgi:hypothetical protein
MLILLIMSAIVGLVAYGFTGIGFLFWLAGGVVFFCGLPFALVTSFVHGEVSYAQDRADYRQTMAEIKAEELADEHEFAEDARIDRLAATVKKNSVRTYNDNRQVHLYRNWNEGSISHGNKKRGNS